MNLLRKIIARLVELISERVLRDMELGFEQRQRSSFSALHARLDMLEQALVASFPAAVLNNEIQNIDRLPLPLLESLPELTVVGHYAEDIKAVLPTCRIAPFSAWPDGTGMIEMAQPFGNLLFLDEYHFVRTMQRLLPTSLRIADSIIVATRFDYLSENRCRSFLHRIGFMEIVLVTVDDLTGDPATWAISHARPITCDPLFIQPRRPVAEPERPILWLIARRLPLHGSPEASDA